MPTANFDTILEEELDPALCIFRVTDTTEDLAFACHVSTKVEEYILDLGPTRGPIALWGVMLVPDLGISHISQTGLMMAGMKFSNGRLVIKVTDEVGGFITSFPVAPMRGWIFWIPEQHKVVTVWNVVFREEEFKGGDRSEVEDMGFEGWMDGMLE
ncbi:hypothetical protein JCM1841_000746, partial [Sporobolomyces salmonicolor]